jgi:hypothetical protein
MIIHVFDTPAVLSKMITMYNSTMIIAEKEIDLIDEAELIVLGPYPIEEKTQKAIIRSGKPVIDLKWHKVINGLYNYENYHCLV